MTADYQGSLVTSQHENFVSDVIMSSKTMVSVYGRSLRLHVLGSELPNIHLEVDPGHGISQAAITANEQWLCVWALGSSGSLNDCAYFWNIASARLFGKEEYKKVFWNFGLARAMCLLIISARIGLRLPIFVSGPFQVCQPSFAKRSTATHSL
jgi:hypothetical protein